ncbi:MAG TPA: 2-methylcitrate dehydratase, partial [Accumulibacter sp.]|nr:2-methylcitrate dehydratase [Accumulibacter sp.]
ALHPQVAGRLESIARVVIRTHESALRIIDKQGPLHNPADRDHCLQYMFAVALINGKLSSEDYEDSSAADPRIDALRAKIVVQEEKRFTTDYLHPDKRSIANAVQIFFADGTHTAELVLEYPLGHLRRRAEGIPVLVDKFRRNLERCFSSERQTAIRECSLDVDRLLQMPVNEYLDLYAL